MRRGMMVIVLSMFFIFNMGFCLPQPAAEERLEFNVGRDYFDMGFELDTREGTILTILVSAGVRVS
jgi:hypothetical protein